MTSQGGKNWSYSPVPYVPLTQLKWTVTMLVQTLNIKFYTYKMASVFQQVGKKRERQCHFMQFFELKKEECEPADGWENADNNI